MKMLHTTLVAAVALLLAAPSTEAQLFEFPSLTDGVDNLVPEWLPQCFNGVDSFNPTAVVDCVQGEVPPSCLQANNIQETFGGVVDCISGSVGDEVMQFFEGLTGGDESSPLEQLEQALTSKQGGGGEQDLGELVDGFLSNIGIGEEADGLFNIAALFVNATRTCLDPLSDCVQETIEQAVVMLEPCLNSTLTELVQCGADHGEACLESCNATEVQAQFESNPFELAFSAVATCPLIQENIMDPFCTLVGCCEPCVAKAEALMSCVINQQLDQVPLQGDCDLTCSSPEQRRLTKRTPSRRMQTVAGPNAPEECLQYAPGLTGGDSEELAARSSIFMPCAYNSFVKAMEEKPAAVSSSGGQSGTNEGGGSMDDSSSAVSSMSLAAVGTVLTLFVMAN